MGANSKIYHLKRELYKDHSEEIVNKMIREIRNRLYSMKQRCYNSKNKDYPRYGGRGITVCEEW